MGGASGVAVVAEKSEALLNGIAWQVCLTSREASSNIVDTLQISSTKFTDEFDMEICIYISIYTIVNTYNLEIFRKHTVYKYLQIKAIFLNWI